MYFNLVLLNVSRRKCFLKDSKFPIEFFTALLPAQWDLISNRWNSTSEIQLFTTGGNVLEYIGIYGNISFLTLL